MFIYYNFVAFKLYVFMFNGNIVFIKKGSTKEIGKSNLIQNNYEYWIGVISWMMVI